MTVKEGERGIEEWRKDIDALDNQLVSLLNKRAEAALAIGKIKRRNNQPVKVPEREKTVIARVTAMNGGPLPNTSIQSIYEAIMAQMRALESENGES